MLPRVLAITDWSRPGLFCYVLTVFVNNLLDVSNYKCYSAFIFSCLSCRVKQRSKFWLTWLKEFLYKLFQSLYAAKETDRQILNGSIYYINIIKEKIMIMVQKCAWILFHLAFFPSGLLHLSLSFFINVQSFLVPRKTVHQPDFSTEKSKSSHN